MLGAIAGDIIGSVYEARPIKTTDFPLFTEGSRFTDDTVLTVAVADALLSGRDYAAVFRNDYARWPDAGYGASFRAWARDPSRPPYGSWGNGSAMRVSPVAWFSNSLEEAVREARRSAVVTHDHPEGIRGAEAVAAAVWSARNEQDKQRIREILEDRFGYDLNFRIDEIRPAYAFELSCAGTVPPAVRAVLEAEGFEEAVRLAVSLGGDSDTLAAIAGSIAEALFGGVPAGIREEVRNRLPAELLDTIDRFLKACPEGARTR